MHATIARGPVQVTTEQRGGALILSVLLALLMAVQATLGLALPALYRDVGYVRETWFGNDLVTLTLAVPILVAGLLLERRGLLLGRLLWLGGLGYGVYNGAFYLLGAALNACFPLYVITVLLAAVALGRTVACTDRIALAAGFGPRTPVRLIGGYLVFVALGLTVVWLGMWAAYIFAGRPTPVAPEAFRLVAALDLTIMVPALAIGGLLLWRRRPAGYLIATLAAVQGSLYLVVLALNSALFIARGLVAAPGELPIWGTLALATTLATLLLLWHARGSATNGATSLW